MSNNTPESDTAPIVACTVSRNTENFDLLIEDMEATLGDSWGDLGFADALAFFAQPEAEAMEFIAIAIDSEDEGEHVLLGEIITQAKAQRIKVILIAEDVSPAALHGLLRNGADEFVPYPLPEGELAQAIERVRAPEPETSEMPAAASGSQKDGALIAIHGLAGGTGSTTLAVNLAWELATVHKKNPPSVCLLDLDLQYGSVATFLDLQRQEVVYDLISDTENMDAESFGNALQEFEEKLHVLTAPGDMLPLDLISPDDVKRILAVAQSEFDYVIVDMPSTLVNWTETVLSDAHIYFATLEMDMRCAQNTLRFKRTLQSEDLPVEKLRYVLNRAPKFTDMNAKSRIKRLAESLSISIDLQMPDGGKQITQANDHGLPLAKSASKSPLRREIAKLAASIHDLKGEAVQAA